MNKVEVYTDGACSGNPGPGGWGLVMTCDSKTKKSSGFQSETTNNRMELQAAIEALKLLKKPCHVILYSDSSYVIKGMKEWVYGWRKNGWRTSANKQVKNADQWQELYELSIQHNVDWIWIKGHAGNPGNEEADRLARLEIETRSGK